MPILMVVNFLHRINFLILMLVLTTMVTLVLKPVVPCQPRLPPPTAITSTKTYIEASKDESSSGATSSSPLATIPTTPFAQEICFWNIRCERAIQDDNYCAQMIVKHQLASAIDPKTLYQEANYYYQGPETLENVDTIKGHCTIDRNECCAKITFHNQNVFYIKNLPPAEDNVTYTVETNSTNTQKPITKCYPNLVCAGKPNPNDWCMAELYAWFKNYNQDELITFSSMAAHCRNVFCCVNIVHAQNNKSSESLIVQRDHLSNNYHTIETPLQQPHHGFIVNGFALSTKIDRREIRGTIVDELSGKTIPLSNIQLYELSDSGNYKALYPGHATANWFGSFQLLWETPPKLDKDTLEVLLFIYIGSSNPAQIIILPGLLEYLLVGNNNIGSSAKGDFFDCGRISVKNYGQSY